LWQWLINNTTATLIIGFCCRCIHSLTCRCLNSTGRQENIFLVDTAVKSLLVMPPHQQ
jgi:hypothetical protein